jgi:gamma-glutamylcysteine synthetase
MGLARLRWKWRPGDAASLEGLKTAYRAGGDALRGFLKENLRKVVLENRSAAAAPPGEELASLALVAGLMANLPAALEFARRKPYGFWLEIALAAEMQPMDSRVEGTCIAALLEEMVWIAEIGLKKRGMAHEELGYLAPLKRRLHYRLSPSERALALFRTGGMDAVVRRLSY